MGSGLCVETLKSIAESHYLLTSCWKGEGDCNLSVAAPGKNWEGESPKNSFYGEKPKMVKNPKGPEQVTNWGRGQMCKLF